MKFSRRARIVLGIFLVLLAAVAIMVAVAIARFEPIARQYALDALHDQYHADVQMGELHISLLPTVKATGDNLVFRLHSRAGVPPLMTIRRFTIEARLIGFFRSPRRIRLLRLEGLRLQIPPHDGRQSSGSGSQGQQIKIPLIFEEIIADGTMLTILPADASKEPLDFDIRELTLHHAGLRQPMTFDAKLTNPRPPGLVYSHGRFGPWQRDDPGQTPLSGGYTFRDAALGVFRGISGTLASNGEYKGELDRIEIHGTADVPNFALTTADHPVPLRTVFDATVDGTNGNTVLHPVRAMLDDSSFEVSGAIERHALEEHKTISLEAKGDHDQIQDFLRLAVKGKPPMTGAITFQSHVIIPPGESDVILRLRLNGSFSMSDVHFTSPDVNRKLASLSNHALGKPKAPDTELVSADLAGRFRMRSGAMVLPALEFSVPGAHIELHGDYALKSGAIDMQGEAKLKATVSEMTTGIKRILLFPVDPLFKRDGAGTVLPIKIGGTRGQPSFHLEIGRVLTRH